MLTGQQLGKYEIRSKIGEGGMGEVYSAHDAELDRSVAIKLLPNEFTTDPERRQRFRQEARVVSALNHPNIITIYEIGEDENGSFLATEFVDGRTLRDVIRQESFTLPRILRIAEQAANALVAAHAADIVHRDIKPENIMVRPDSIVKVLDFGLAKPNEQIILSGDSSSNRTVPGTVMGSARYMSPEQARGQDVDGRTDIWSLGVVLYEMLTGMVPFNGETTADTLAAVIYKEPEPIGALLPNAPAELQRILRKALQKDREERYQSVKDLALDLKDLLYDIEHANSGNRPAHVTSSPNFSENPTIIHQTQSGNHPTGQSAVMTAIHAPTPAVRKRSRILMPLVAILAVGLFAFAGLAFYSWGIADPPLAVHAFMRPQISRINTDGKVNLPAISPDGRYVAYVAGDLGSRSLVVRQVATDSVITVIPPTNLNFSSVSFSPTGDHIYYCETRQDFSINTLYSVPTLGGTPKKLIEDVDSQVSFSPDGKQLVFIRHVSASNDTHLIVADNSTLQTQQLITAKEAGYDFFSGRPAWSPDGKTILVGGGKRQNGSVSEMAVGEVSVADKKLRSLNSGKFFTVANFVWFADGSGFVFTGRESQTSPVQIWRSSYPDIDVHQVTNDFNDYLEVGLSNEGRTLVTLKGEVNSTIWRLSPASKEPVQLSADGRNPEGTLGMGQLASGRVIYTRKEGKESRMLIADADGKNPRQIGPEGGFVIGPVVSRDEKYIYFNFQKPGSSRIWRTDIDGKNAVQLSDDGNHGDYNPQLTADGSTVIFQRQINNDDRSQLMKVPSGGGAVTPFYSNEERGAWGPRMSPDGSRIAFTTYDVRTYEKKIIVARLNGGEFGGVERELDFNLVNQIAWAPDGKSLTLLSSRSGLPNLWSQPIDGSAAKPMTDFKTGQIFNFAWAADGKNILLAKGSINNDLILIRDPDRAAASPSAKSVAKRRPFVRVFDLLTSVFSRTGSLR